VIGMGSWRTSTARIRGMYRCTSAMGSSVSASSMRGHVRRSIRCCGSHDRSALRLLRPSACHGFENRPWPASLRGQGDGRFRAARSIVIVPTVVVTVPIPVMIPVVVPVVIGVLHSFAVPAAIVPLGLHNRGSDRTRRDADPHQCRRHRANMIRRISYSPSTLAGDRLPAEHLRTWDCATAATVPVGEVLMAAHETLAT
jgi:hypothetical protein